jgi:hypothetical protein
MEIFVFFSEVFELPSLYQGFLFSATDIPV